MRKKNLIIVSMLMIVAIMSIGYAYFATTLNITTTGNISSSWNVKFTNMSAGDANGTKATSLSSSYTDTTATMSVDLKEPGDEMTYELTLTNLGDITAVIEDINAEATGSSAIVFNIDGIKEKDTLAKNEYKTIKVKIGFDKNTTSFPSETTKTLTISIRTTQLVDQDISNPAVPNINQQLLAGTLSNAILRDNIAKADTSLDFGSPSSIPVYKESHATITESVSMNESYSYYKFGSGYTYDNTTGKYTLTGVKTGKWTSMESSLTNYPYTCSSRGSSSCDTMYKMVSYTSTTSGTGYKYTSKIEKYTDNGSGLYYTNVNTENNGTTYYFRGNVENNYVKFGTETLGNCTYNGKEVNWYIYYDAADNTKMSESLCLSTVVYEDKTYDESNPTYYVGISSDISEAYGFTSTGKMATFTPTIGTKDIYWRIVRINEDGSIRLIYSGNSIEEDETDDIIAFTYYDHQSYQNELQVAADIWYDSVFGSDNSLIVTPGFCNAENYDPEFPGGDDFPIWGRLSSPQFKCPNGLIMKEVGGITADEAIYAGLNGSYLNIGISFFTPTRALNADNGYNARIDENGGLDLGGYVDYYAGIRPVINVSRNAMVTGNGTPTNPYVIQTNS